MVDVEKLIEEVRKFPVLYDQTSEKYRNSEYKDRVWTNISTTLGVKGKCLHNIFTVHFYISIFIYFILVYD